MASKKDAPANSLDKPTDKIIERILAEHRKTDLPNDDGEEEKHDPPPPRDGQEYWGVEDFDQAFGDREPAQQQLPSDIDAVADGDDSSDEDTTAGPTPMPPLKRANVTATLTPPPPEDDPPEDGMAPPMMLTPGPAEPRQELPSLGSIKPHASPVWDPPDDEPEEAATGRHPTGDPMPAPDVGRKASDGTAEAEREFAKRSEALNPPTAVQVRKFTPIYQRPFWRWALAFLLLATGWAVAAWLQYSLTVTRNSFNEQWRDHLRQYHNSTTP
jgi:hypothetical protein